MEMGAQIVSTFLVISGASPSQLKLLEALITLHSRKFLMCTQEQNMEPCPSCRPTSTDFNTSTSSLDITTALHKALD